MKIVIDVPDVLPANFQNPSQELRAFIKDFTDLCARITKQYRQADGRHLFNAYVRCEADRVTDTDDGEISKIKYYSEAGDTFDDEDEESCLSYEEFPESEVVMDEDLPGNWVVARLCIEGWKGPRGMFETVHSRDFEEIHRRPPRIQELMGRIFVHLDKIAHTVPSRPRL